MTNDTTPEPAIDHAAWRDVRRFADEIRHELRNAPDMMSAIIIEGALHTLREYERALRDATPMVVVRAEELLARKEVAK